MFWLDSIGAQRVKNACIAFRNFCDEQNIEAWVTSWNFFPPFSFLFSQKFMNHYFFFAGAWDVFNKWNKSITLWRTSLKLCSGLVVIRSWLQFWNWFLLFGVFFSKLLFETLLCWLLLQLEQQIVAAGGSIPMVEMGFWRPSTCRES